MVDNLGEEEVIAYVDGRSHNKTIAKVHNGITIVSVKPKLKGKPQICVIACTNCLALKEARLVDIRYGSNRGMCKACCNSEENNGRYTHGAYTGASDRRLYTIWCNMIARCENEASPDYVRYGGLGVFVCEGWRHDFKAFETWSLNNGYSAELQIDKDKRHTSGVKRYSPETCSWLTRAENNKFRAKRNTYVQDRNQITRGDTTNANR